MTVMGIDPGLTGGVAVLGDDCLAAKMPLNGKDIDGAQIARWVQLFKPKMVIIEKQWPRPAHGTIGAHKSGTNYGILIGVMYSLGQPFDLVSPQKWKKATCGFKKKGSDHKAAAADHVARKYPWAEIRGPKGGLFDGICDALCIAEFGQ